MNKTEERFEREVLMPLVKDGTIIWHGFEAMSFKWAKDARYTPDFMVQYDDGRLVAFEVKGAKKDGSPLIEEAALVRIKTAAQMFPVEFRMQWQVKGQGWQERSFE
jgi:hypothetical protein